MESTSDSDKAAALTGTGPISAVDSIIALQGIGDWAEQRTVVIDQGEQLLALLDHVRDGLLAGGIPHQTLSRLAVAVAKRRDCFADAKLQTILDEIEVRARVELAKLELASRPRAVTPG